jgi:hypothetical protein
MEIVKFIMDHMKVNIREALTIQNFKDEALVWVETNED